LSHGLCSNVYIYQDCTIYSQHKTFALFFNGPEECSVAGVVGLQAATMSSTLWGLV